MKLRTLTTLTKLTTLTAIIAAAVPTLATASGAPIRNIQCLINNSDGLNPKVLKAALNAYQWAVAHGKVRNQRIMTVVDLTKHSRYNRMWVIDLRTSKILMTLQTTNGKNSGSALAHSFSNRPGSYQSSPGLYVTGEMYYGKHGPSVRLRGLEPGVNDKAEARAVVIHPAWYASPSFISSHGRAGGSWGCFAVDPNKASTLAKLIKGGSVLYAYSSSHHRFS